MSRMKDIATEALLEERGKDWGDPVITHTQTAKVWSGLLHRKLIADIEPHEVASMMSGLKLVRHTINPSNPDSLDDADAYNAINRRCLDEEKLVQLDEMNKALMPNWVRDDLATMLAKPSPLEEMFQHEQCDCETCVQARLELNKRGFVVVPAVQSDEDEEIDVATVGENWLEVPLPGFGTGPAAPAADTGELLLQGIENESLYEDEALRLAAEAKLSDSRRCINCGQRVFYLEGDYGVMAGHIYSPSGFREMDSSGLCEYCFDKITQEVELGEAEPRSKDEGPNE